MALLGPKGQLSSLAGPVPAGWGLRRALSVFPRWPAREQNAALGRASKELRQPGLSPTAVATQPALPVPPGFALRLSPAFLPENSALKSEVWLPSDATGFQGMWLQAQLRTEAKARPSKVGMSVAVQMRSHLFTDAQNMLRMWWLGLNLLWLSF